jgi:hypothetical protein
VKKIANREQELENQTVKTETFNKKLKKFIYPNIDVNHEDYYKFGYRLNKFGYRLRYQKFLAFLHAFLIEYCNCFHYASLVLYLNKVIIQNNSLI